MIGITTAFFIVARECTNWAAATGKSSFRESLRLCSQTNSPTDRGHRRAIFTTPSLETPTLQRCVVLTLGAPNQLLPIYQR